MEKNITLLEALTGFSFKIKTLDNHEIQVASIPGEIIHDGTTDEIIQFCSNFSFIGSKKVVKGYGMPFYGDAMSHGNLIVTFKVDFPKAGSISDA